MARAITRSRSPRTGAIAAALAAAAALSALAPNALRAATSYTITASTVSGYGVTRSEFVRSGCSAAFTSDRLNGLDGYVIDGRPYAGRSVRIVWDAPVSGSVLAAEMFTAGCQPSGTAPMASTMPGAWTFGVPLGTRWLVVQPMYAVNVVFTAAVV